MTTRPGRWLSRVALGCLACGCLACGGSTQAGRSAHPELFEDVPELGAAYERGGSSAAASGSRLGVGAAASRQPAGSSETQQLSGRFGGPVSASELSPECRGFIAAQPNHQLYNQAERPFLQLAVSADPYDTTLVVGLPDGSFRCNDDADGLNPAVLLGPAPAGSLRIWVGSYSPGESGEYRLAVTTDPRARAGGVGPDAPD